MALKLLNFKEFDLIFLDIINTSSKAIYIISGILFSGRYPKWEQQGIVNIIWWIPLHFSWNLLRKGFDFSLWSHARVAKHVLVLTADIAISVPHSLVALLCACIIWFYMYMLFDSGIFTHAQFNGRSVLVRNDLKQITATVQKRSSKWS